MRRRQRQMGIRDRLIGLAMVNNCVVVKNTGAIIGVLGLPEYGSCLAPVGDEIVTLLIRKHIARGPAGLKQDIVLGRIRDKGPIEGRLLLPGDNSIGEAGSQHPGAVARGAAPPSQLLYIHIGKTVNFKELTRAKACL